MQDPETKMYLLLVRKVTYHLNILNKYLQNEKIIIHRLRGMLITTYKNILLMILNKKYVEETAAEDINIWDTTQHLHTINIDEESSDIMQKNAMEEFTIRAFNFVMVVANQMEIRFDRFKEPLLIAVECLDPGNATSLAFHQARTSAIEDLLKLCNIIIANGRYNPNRIIEQWGFLVNFEMENASIEEFWMGIRFDVEGMEELAEFALLVLAIPQSSVAPERVFSAQNHAKRSYKSTMSNATLNATLKVQEMLREEPDAALWKPTEEMIMKVVHAKFYKNKNNDNI